MANASYSSGTFTGGSSTDRLLVDDLAGATGSPYTKLIDNVISQTTVGGLQVTFDPTSFLDLTGAVILLRNSATSGSTAGGALAFKLNGDAIIGDSDDLIPRDCEIILGPRDYDSGTWRDLLGDGSGKFVCADNSRLILRHIHDDTAYTTEPGARSRWRIKQVNPASKLRITTLAGPAAIDTDWTTKSGTGSTRDKRNGSQLFEWRVSSDVPVRDLEFYDAFIDWRPSGKEVSTTISNTGGYAAGSTSIVLASGSGINGGDTVKITLSDGTIDYRGVASKSTATITLTAGLSGAADDGATVVKPGWAPPTRGVFNSWGGMKWYSTGNVYTESSPLIFGNTNDSFVVTVGAGGEGTNYFLYGLSPSGATGRTVFMNLDGPDANSRLAVYNASKEMQVENHLSLDVRLISPAGSVISGGKVRIHSRDPAYGASTSTASVTFPATVRTNEATTDASGEATIGGATGAYSQAICTEAFHRVGGANVSGTGAVDGAYATAAHTRGAYASHVDLTYDILAFGYVPQIAQTFTAAKSGETGAGKQTLGTITLTNDPVVTSADAASVPSAAATFDDVYDLIHAYCITNNLAMPLSVSGVTATQAAGNLTLSSTASAVSKSGDDWTVPCATTLATGTKITTLVLGGASATFILTSVTVTAPLTDSTGTTGRVQATCSDSSATVALFAANGTERGKGTGSVDVSLTSAQCESGMRIVAARAGYTPQVRTLDASAGGSFVISLGTLDQEKSPDGSNQYDSSLVTTSKVSLVNWSFSNLGQSNQAISRDFAAENSSYSVELFYKLAQDESVTSNGLKWLAFGGTNPTYLKNPTAGDLFFADKDTQFRSASASHTNSGIKGNVVHPSDAPVASDTPSPFTIAAGVQINDITNAVWFDEDLDLNTAGQQSPAALVSSIGATVQGIANGLVQADLDSVRTGVQTYSSLLIEIEAALSDSTNGLAAIKTAVGSGGGGGGGNAPTTDEIVTAIKAADFPAVSGEADRLGSLLHSIEGTLLSSVALPATLTSPTKGTKHSNGYYYYTVAENTNYYLHMTIDGTSVQSGESFGGATEWQAAAICNAINLVAGDAALATVDADGGITVRTKTTGASASLAVSGNFWTSILGFTSGDSATGSDATGLQNIVTLLNHMPQSWMGQGWFNALMDGLPQSTKDALKGNTTTPPTAAAIVQAVLAASVESGIDIQTSLRRLLAIVAGKSRVAGDTRQIFSRLDSSETEDWEIEEGSNAGDRTYAGAPRP